MKRGRAKRARMAELVYAFDLKSNGEIHMGSSPISGTIDFTPKYGVFFMFCSCLLVLAYATINLYKREQ